LSCLLLADLAAAQFTCMTYKDVSVDPTTMAVRGDFSGTGDTATSAWSALTLGEGLGEGVVEGCAGATYNKKASSCLSAPVRQIIPYQADAVQFMFLGGAVDGFVPPLVPSQPIPPQPGIVPWGGDAPGGCMDSYMCIAGYVDSRTYTLDVGDVVHYDYTAGGGQYYWFEVAVVLMDASNGNQVYAKFKRGETGRFTESLYTITSAGDYFVRFFLGSYDRTGGGHAGTQLTVHSFSAWQAGVVGPAVCTQSPTLAPLNPTRSPTTSSPTQAPTTYPTMAPATPETVTSIDVPDGWKAAPRYLTANEAEIRQGSYFLALEQFTTMDPVNKTRGSGPGLADFWWVNRSLRGATVFDITPTFSSESDSTVPISPSVFPINSSFTVHCTVSANQQCDVFAFIYHDPPISSTTNGGLITLVDDGWEASSCAPAFRLHSNGGPKFNPDGESSGGAYEGCVYHMVAMRNTIGNGESVTVKLEERRGAFILFAVVPKAVCVNTMTEEECSATHTEDGPLSTCEYVDNSCIDNWCARRKTTRPPAFTRPPTVACPAANAGL